MLATMLSIALLGQIAPPPHFMVEQEGPLSQEILTRAEAYKKTICQEWFGVEPPRFTAMISYNLSDSFRGVTETRIVLPPVIKLSGTEKEILFTGLPHEIAHTITTWQLSCTVPLWASEGISMMCEKEYEGGRSNSTLAQYATIEPLSSFLSRSTYPSGLTEFYYGQAYSFARFLVEMKGKKAFTAFLQDQRHAQDWSSTLGRHYGFKNLPEAEAAWMKWHKKTFGKFIMHPNA